ncbi:MAG: hypothetical protein NTY74_10470 [Ignavibacteriae bacterium]|nr:hypothetical protein [Ignavibacteriota bacterium]
MVITREITVKELIFTFPASTSYFMKHKVKLLVSGDARWGTLEEVLIKKNFSEDDINRMIDELNDLYKERQIK